jgi:hypothetical protein
LVASAIGIAISSVGSKQIVAALRRLLASTRAIEQGQTDVTAVITTRVSLPLAAPAAAQKRLDIDRQHIRPVVGDQSDRLDRLAPALAHIAP